MAERFAVYAELLQRWNARLNLTALGTPEQILQRHFIESIFCAQYLCGDPATLLDFGSGAGFPGIPIALCRPEIQVTLAESNGRKAAFLREVVRTLSLKTVVYAGRVEGMPPEILFDAVTMRAVDKMETAINAAAARVNGGGRLALLTTLQAAVSIPAGFAVESTLPLPNSADRVLIQWQRR